MISAITNVLTNPVLVNVVKSTDATVAAKTAVNSVGRPGFILADNNISSDTKKFAASKEFLYQACCLAVYMAVIVPVFKKGGFKLAKSKIFKNTQGFEHFDSFSEYTQYRKIADILDMEQRNQKLKELTAKNKVNFGRALIQELSKDVPDKFVDVKGAINLSNLIGSIVGLSIIAPKVSTALTTPALKALGLDNKKANSFQAKN